MFKKIYRLFPCLTVSRTKAPRKLHLIENYISLLSCLPVAYLSYKPRKLYSSANKSKLHRQKCIIVVYSLRLLYIAENIRRNRHQKHMLLMKFMHSLRLS